MFKESSIDKSSDCSIDSESSCCDGYCQNVSVGAASDDVNTVSVNVSIQAQALGSSVIVCHKWIAGKEVGAQKVLRPATSTQVFLGFPVPISKRSDGSQQSKLPLHASHVALRT